MRETAYPFKILDLNGFTTDELDTYEQYKHIFLGNDRVVTKLRDDSMNESVSFFYHKDHIGSSSLMTDTSGSEYTYDEYYPYGSKWINSNKKDLSDPSAGVKHYFTGHEYDKETQLYYMLARYYDPELGGFLSGDPAMEGMDSYKYSMRNPVYYKDPDGKEVEFFGLFIEGSSALNLVLNLGVALDNEGNQRVYFGIDVKAKTNISVDFGVVYGGVADNQNRRVTVDDFHNTLATGGVGVGEVISTEFGRFNIIADDKEHFQGTYTSVGFGLGLSPIDLSFGATITGTGPKSKSTYPQIWDWVTHPERVLKEWIESWYGCISAKCASGGAVKPEGSSEQSKETSYFDAFVTSVVLSMDNGTFTDARFNDVKNELIDIAGKNINGLEKALQLIENAKKEETKKIMD